MSLFFLLFKHLGELHSTAERSVDAESGLYVNYVKCAQKKNKRFSSCATQSWLFLLGSDSVSLSFTIFGSAQRLLSSLPLFVKAAAAAGRGGFYKNALFFRSPFFSCRLVRWQHRVFLTAPSLACGLLCSCTVLWRNIRMLLFFSMSYIKFHWRLLPAWYKQLGHCTFQ